MASSNPSPYVYDPLPTPDHTRIVELLPAAHQAAPLQCRLVPLDLDDDDPALRYEALSYTWGQPVLSEQLFVQNHDKEGDIRVLHITPSLASALRRLRCGSSAVRRIWADAVCINQGDMADKSRQIPLMSTIYRGAYRVVVWLDPGGTTHGHSEARARRLNALIRRRSVRREVLQAGPLSEAANLLEQHFAMPWFSRRWIIQEVVGHPDVALLCGDQETGWLRLMALATNVFADVKVAPAVVTSALMMFDLWRMWVVGESRSGKCRLMKLLERFEHFGCADDRDRIYALAGLAEDGHGVNTLVPINMDYTTSTEQLYTKFAEELIKAGYLSWVLQQACARRCINKGGLPSWVPDWRVPSATKTIWGADAGKSRASVQPFGTGTHALTANLGSLRTWKPRAGEREAPRPVSTPWNSPYWLSLRVWKPGETVALRTVRRSWGERLEIESWQTGEHHIDVLPYEVEWKNSKEYPHGQGATALQKWIFATAHEIQSQNPMEGGWADLDARRTLQKLLVECCHRQLGHFWNCCQHHLSYPSHPNMDDWKNGYVDAERLDEYVSQKTSPTVEVKRLIQDIDALMAGRCIFSCSVRSPLSSPSSAPYIMVFIGPSETRVGDRVISLQRPNPAEEEESSVGYGSGTSGRFWGHSYVVRKQSIQTASLFPSMREQIASSQTEFTGFQLVGDCFPDGNTFRAYPSSPPERGEPGAWMWGPPKESDYGGMSDWGTMGLFLC